MAEHARTKGEHVYLMAHAITQDETYVIFLSQTENLQKIMRNRFPSYSHSRKYIYILNIYSFTDDITALKFPCN